MWTIVIKLQRGLNFKFNFNSSIYDLQITTYPNNICPNENLYSQNAFLQISDLRLFIAETRTETDKCIFSHTCQRCKSERIPLCIEHGHFWCVLAKIINFTIGCGAP